MFAVQAVNVSTFSPLIAPNARKHWEALLEQNDPHPDPLPSDGICVYRGASARVTHGVFGALGAAVRAGRPPVEQVRTPGVPSGVNVAKLPSNWTSPSVMSLAESTGTVLRLLMLLICDCGV